MQNILGLENLGKEVQITRYETNRKLRISGVSSITKASKLEPYVTFAVVKELIKQGKQITVKSYPGDRDVTADVLKSILLQDEKSKLDSLSPFELTSKVKDLGQ